MYTLDLLRHVVLMIPIPDQKLNVHVLLIFTFYIISQYQFSIFAYKLLLGWFSGYFELLCVQEFSEQRFFAFISLCAD